MNIKNLRIKKFNEYIEVLLEKDLSIVEILSDENLEQNSSTQIDHEEISNKSSESSKPIDRYIASMNKTNKE